MPWQELKKLYIPSEIESIDAKTFTDCDNLKELHIFYSSYGKVFMLRVNCMFINNPDIPFENIILENGITTIADNTSFLFKNAHQVILPSTLEEIDSNSFKGLNYLDYLSIPKRVNSIDAKTFDDNITLDIEGFKRIKAKDILMLKSKRTNNFKRKGLNNYDSKILALKDGTYYVFINDYDPIRITRDEIESFSDSSKNLVDDPDIFLDYLNDLLEINSMNHIKLMNIIDNEELKTIFTTFLGDIDSLFTIAKHKQEEVIKQLVLHAKGGNELLFNVIIMRDLSKSDVIHIVDNITPTLIRFIRYNDLFNSEKTIENDSLLKNTLNNIPIMVRYCNYLDENHINDRFLYNPRFFIRIPDEYQRLIISCYNANIKRMILESNILASYDIENRNLLDLLKFAKILGVFSNDPIISQKSTTFITEKIFANKLPNGKINHYKISGDDIHRIFSEIEINNDVNREFIEFFITYYKELIDIERITSGFIVRVYNNFKDISKCSSSNSGEQRHLKVTIDKCLEYFLMKSYKNVSEENIELAKLLAKYYDNELLLDVAASILKASKEAPRNIFGSYKIVDGKQIFSNNPNEDLKEPVNNYSYEWLIKQDPINLVLGKFCNCCAHINGAGGGIMRASMTLDNVQNLVIKDECGTIVAKMTLWIDKDAGYGVFNTAEVNFNNRADEDLIQIYEAFKKGCIAFINAYNKNNPDNKINTITIGEKRNILEGLIKKENGEAITPYPSIHYGKLNYAVGASFVGTYDGDAHLNQLLVYKK